MVSVSLYYEVDARIAAGQKIVSVSLYYEVDARIADGVVDFILVGDSVAMVEHGFGSTQAATMQMMVDHGRQVVNGARNTPVVIDLPERLYVGRSNKDILSASKELMCRTGCSAVKLEGGVDLAGAVSYLVKHDVPVMGHIGLLPSRFAVGEKFKIQGRGDEGVKQVSDDAFAIQAAGAFALVIEGVIESVASHVSRLLTIPSVGIGASRDCDGQILVYNDLIGTTKGHVAKFAKNFAGFGHSPKDAIIAYALAVRAVEFPDPIEHCYATREQKEKLAGFYASSAPKVG